MGKPLPIGAEFSITSEPIDIEQPKSLASELVSLSERVQDCYRVALEKGREDVATELILLANGVGSLIAKALRGELKGQS